jgi:hypothetical protein
MKCFYCLTPVIWGNDFDTEEVYGESNYLFTSNYSCPNSKCEAMYEVLHEKKEVKNEH